MARAEVRSEGSMAKALNILHAQRERLAFLQLIAFFVGAPRRGDIESQFDIKPAGASRDLGLFREVAPDQMDYDPVSCCYWPTSAYIPINDFHAEYMPGRLLPRFGDGLRVGLKLKAPWECSGQLGWPDMACSGAIRSMRSRSVLRGESPPSFAGADAAAPHLSPWWQQMAPAAARI